MSKLLSIILIVVGLLLLLLGFFMLNDLPPETTPLNTVGDQTELVPKTEDEFYNLYTFGGEEIGIIMSGYKDAIRSITIPLDGDATEAVNVAVANRNKMVEDQELSTSVYNG